MELLRLTPLKELRIAVNEDHLEHVVLSDLFRANDAVREMGLMIPTSRGLDSSPTHVTFAHSRFRRADRQGVSGTQLWPRVPSVLSGARVTAMCSCLPGCFQSLLPATLSSLK